MKVVWLLFQHSVRSDLKSHRKILEVFFPFGQDGGQLGSYKRFLRYLNLWHFLNCLNLPAKSIEHKWPILKGTWVWCTREAVSFGRELCCFRPWKRSCVRWGWCATAVAVLMGKHRMSSSFFRRWWWLSFLVLRLWCDFCCDFSWH